MSRVRCSVWCLCVWSWFSLSLVSAADGTVEITPGPEDTMKIQLNGKPFATYNYGKKWAKPFLYPVLTPAGDNLTRDLAAPTSNDHPHHKGVWCAIDEVNDIKFWAEKGRIENKEVKILTAQGNPAKLRVVNHWVDDAGKPVVIETTDISFYADGLLTYDIHMQAGDKLVNWGDTKEGMFGIRVADTMRETEGGKIVNAEGLETTQNCWGKVSDWVDYSGPVKDKIQGVALFDHPLNFRRSRYHVRAYGLFTLSPFGQHSYTNGLVPADPLLQLPGSSFRLQYGLYFHPGDAKEGGVADKYVEFLKRTTH